MLPGQRRDTDEELFARLTHTPIILRSHAKHTIGLLIVSAYVSLLVGLMVAAGGLTLAAIQRQAAIDVGFASAIVVSAGFAWALFGTRRGYDLRADERGLTLFRFGARLWSAEWGRFVVEGYGIGLSRSRLRFSDGTAVKLPEFYTGDAEGARKVRRLLRTHRAEPEKPTLRSIVVSLVLTVATISIGFWLATAGNLMVQRHFDPEVTNAPALSLSVSLVILGGLAISFGMIYFLVPLSHLCSHIESKPESLHGPALREFKLKYGVFAKPIQMDDGVRYRYLDPKALRSERTAVVPMTALFFLLGSCLWLLPPDQVVRDNILVARLVQASFSLAGLLPLLGLKREREARACINDTLWIEDDRLFVERDGRTASFPLSSLRPRRPPMNKSGTALLGWFESVQEGATVYRFDRRYLWPIETTP